MIIKDMKIEKSMRAEGNFDPNAPEKYNCLYALLIQTDVGDFHSAVYVDDPIAPEHAAKMFRAFADAINRIDGMANVA